MKTPLKFLALFLMSIVIFNNAKAQSSMYVRLGAGVGFGLNPSIIGTDVTSTYTNNGTTATYSTTQTPDKHSPGAGIYPEAAFGYMLNDNIGFELGFSYEIGFSTTVTQSADSTGSFGGYTESGTGSSSTKYSFHTFLITPAFVIKANSDKKLIPYGRLGLSISLASEGTMDDVYNSSETGNAPGYTPYSSTGEYATQTTGSVQLGVNAAAGVSYKLSDNFLIYLEVNARALNFKLDQTTVTTATSNGVDELSSYTTSEKQVNYVSSITTTNTTAVSPGSPSQELTQVIPVSSIGLAIGVKLTFGGK